jgi:hypothetical protein
VQVRPHVDLVIQQPYPAAEKNMPASIGIQPPYMYRPPGSPEPLSYRFLQDECHVHGVVATGADGSASPGQTLHKAQPTRFNDYGYLFCYSL